MRLTACTWASATLSIDSRSGGVGVLRDVDADLRPSVDPDEDMAVAALVVAPPRFCLNAGGAGDNGVVLPSLLNESTEELPPLILPPRWWNPRDSTRTVSNDDRAPPVLGLELGVGVEDEEEEDVKG